MTITLNLQLLYEALAWVKLNPWALGVAWYFIALFVIRYTCQVSQEEYNKVKKEAYGFAEAFYIVIWVLSPIVFPAYLLCNILIKIKKETPQS